MRTLPLLIAVVSLLATGCATQYTVTQEELQHNIDQRLPVKSALEFSGASGELLAKTVQLDVGRAYPGRVALAATGSVSIPTPLGQLQDDYSCAFSGRLRFNPQDRGVYLSDVAVSSLEFKGLSQVLPPDWYASATQQARQLLVAQLTAGPLYTLQDKTFAESWFRRHGSAINVEQGRLVFQLGGTPGAAAAAQSAPAKNP